MHTGSVGCGPANGEKEVLISKEIFSQLANRIGLSSDSFSIHVRKGNHDGVEERLMPRTQSGEVAVAVEPTAPAARIPSLASGGCML